jgi:hypothetical protein
MPAFTFEERPNSRGGTTSPPTETRYYRAAGITDESYIRAAAPSLTPAMVIVPTGILYRQDISLEPGGFALYYLTVPYATRKNEVGDWSWDFDTTGGSIHIKVSKQTVARFPAGSKDHKQLIGVNGDDVAGTDIVIPAMKINATFKHPLGVVTIPFAKTVRRNTGKVNSDTFLHHAPGEVLSLGGRGADGSTAEAEVTYSFGCEENLQDEVVGTITDVRKDGWDVSWIAWKDNDADDKPGKEPLSVNIERVYKRIAMATAFGFGG